MTSARADMEIALKLNLLHFIGVFRTNVLMDRQVWHFAQRLKREMSGDPVSSEDEEDVVQQNGFPVRRRFNWAQYGMSYSQFDPGEQQSGSLASNALASTLMRRRRSILSGLPDIGTPQVAYLESARREDIRVSLDLMMKHFVDVQDGLTQLHEIFATFMLQVLEHSADEANHGDLLLHGALDAIQKYMRFTFSSELLCETQVFQLLLTSEAVHQRFLSQNVDKRALRSFYRVLGHLWLSDKTKARRNPMNLQGNQREIDDPFECNISLVERILDASNSQADFIKVVQVLRGVFSAANYSAQYGKLLDWLIPTHLDKVLAVSQEEWQQATNLAANAAPDAVLNFD